MLPSLPVEADVIDIASRLRAVVPTAGFEVSVAPVADRFVVSVRLFRNVNDRHPAASAIAVVAALSRHHATDALAEAMLDAEHQALQRAMRAIGIPCDAALEDVSPPSPALVSRASTAVRTPARFDDPYELPTLRGRSGRGVVNPAADTVARVLRERVTDLTALIASASHAGVRPRRVAMWRAALLALADAEPATVAAIERAERRLRRWLVRRDPM